MSDSLESALLRRLVDGDVDSEQFAESTGSDHNAVVGVIKSLVAHEMVVAEVRGALQALCFAA